MGKPTADRLEEGRLKDRQEDRLEEGRLEEDRLEDRISVCPTPSPLTRLYTPT